MLHFCDDGSPVFVCDSLYPAYGTGTAVFWYVRIWICVRPVPGVCRRWENRFQESEQWEEAVHIPVPPGQRMAAAAENFRI